MPIEHEPPQKAENTLTIEVGGKPMSCSRRVWYTNKNIASMVGMTLPAIYLIIKRIRDDGRTIEFTTLGELNRKGNLPFDGRPQTILYNEANFIKAVVAVDLIKTKKLFRKTHFQPNTHKSPASEKEPKNPNSNNLSPFNPYGAITESPPEPPIHTEDIPPIKDPKQILGINSVLKALSHTANGTLENDIPNNIKEFLEQVAMEHVRLSRFEDDSIEGILTKILNDDSTNRLNRFFRVNLDAFLDDLWDVTDAKKRTSDEQQIIKICNLLKENGYDKERIVQELLDHFSIPPKQTQEGPQIDITGRMGEIVFIPNRRTQAALAPAAPIRREETIFEAGNHSHIPQHDNTGKKMIKDQVTQPSGQQEKDRKKLREEILSQTIVEILKKVLANNHIPPDVRIILGHYLPPKRNLPEIFNYASQKELNRLVIGKLYIALSKNPNRDKILSEVRKTLKTQEPVQDEDLRRSL